jgi:hypothetical protein
MHAMLSSGNCTFASPHAGSRTWFFKSGRAPTFDLSASGCHGIEEADDLVDPAVPVQADDIRSQRGRRVALRAQRPGEPDEGAVACRRG